MADKKVGKSVLALSSAAVLAIYGAGYARTREAADRFALQANERRPRVPTPRTQEPAPAIPASQPIAAPIADAPPAEPPRRTRLAADATTSPAPPIAPKPTESAAPASVTAAAPVTVAEPSEPQAPAPSTPTEPPVAITPPPAPVAQASGYKDGTYYGWGSCRHGDIQAAVVIESGRITQARVERCLTRYSCNWIEPIPPRILSKQATTYDYVSGATESSDAFQDAVAEALSQAK